MLPVTVGPMSSDRATSNPRMWTVDYLVRSGIDPSAGPVSTGQVRVSATSEREAAEVAVAWVHSNDPYADPRVDPVVTATDVEEDGEDDEAAEADDAAAGEYPSVERPA